MPAERWPRAARHQGTSPQANNVGSQFILRTTRPRLIHLQFKEDIGIRAEARSQCYRCWRAGEPIAADFLGQASFAVAKRSGIAQTQVRCDTAARLNTEALHHLTNVD
jgi:hypothetical protein